MSGVSIDMHARNFGSNLRTMLAWINTTPEIDQAAEQAYQEAVKYFRVRDNLGPLYNEQLKARGAEALQVAESALDRLAATLTDANPNGHARGIGIAWK
jgi:phage baseplate assembly protein W